MTKYSWTSYLSTASVGLGIILPERVFKKWLPIFLLSFHTDKRVIKEILVKYFGVSFAKSGLKTAILFF